MKTALVAMLIASNIVASVSGPNFVYTTTDLNVRRAPGLEYAIVTTVPPHSELSYSEIVTTYNDEKWVKIEVNEVPYYVSADYVTFEEPAPEDKVTVYQVEPGAPGVHFVIPQ